MVTVVRGNSELRVPDSEAAAYLAKGYAVVDAKGKVVDSGKQHTYEELLVLHKNDQRTIRRLEARITDLETQLSEAKATKPEGKGQDGNDGAGGDNSTQPGGDGTTTHEPEGKGQDDTPNGDTPAEGNAEVPKTSTSGDEAVGQANGEGKKKTAQRGSKA